MPATGADGFYPSSQSSSARVNRPFRRDESNLDYPLSHTISVVSSVLKVRTLQTRIPCVAVTRLRLETSYCNGVPAFCPVFSGLQTGSCSLSPACQISLNILGEMLARQLDNSFHEYYCCVLRSALTPPCGHPLRVVLNFHSSKYPLSSRCRTSLRNR